MDQMVPRENIELMPLVLSASQKALLANALSVTNRVPSIPTANGVQGAEENSWKNCWNWLVRPVSLTGS